MLIDRHINLIGKVAYAAHSNMATMGDCLNIINMF